MGFRYEENLTYSVLQLNPLAGLLIISFLNLDLDQYRPVFL